MATPTPLTYYGLPSGLSDGKSARLQVATPNGTIREIPLNRQQLHKLLQAAARALEELDRAEARAAKAARPCSACGHPNPGDWCPGCGRQA